MKNPKFLEKWLLGSGDLKNGSKLFSNIFYLESERIIMISYSVQVIDCKCSKFVISTFLHKFTYFTYFGQNLYFEVQTLGKLKYVLLKLSGRPKMCFQWNITFIKSHLVLIKDDNLALSGDKANQCRLFVMSSMYLKSNHTDLVRS